jgi:hypothetical protein
MVSEPTNLWKIKEPSTNTLLKNVDLSSVRKQVLWCGVVTGQA